jgi:cytochrome P450 PksS
MNAAAIPSPRTLDTSNIFLADPQLKPNPYPLYARLRDEAHVARVRFSKTGSAAWLITRYDDVVSVLKDQRIGTDRRNADSSRRPLRIRVLHSVFSPLIDNMLGTDEPDHARLRGLVHQAFTPKRVEELRGRVESLTEELMERASGRRPWDVVADYALIVPTTIIAEMLGVPVRDRERFLRWSNALLLASATQWYGMLANAPKFLAFMRYVRGLINERRKRPQDDMISALVAAEEAGDRLDQDELLAMVFLLLIGGYETTANLIGTGTLALLENPEQMEKLRANPALMKSAIEEMLRYYSPVDYAQVRGARTDLEIAGVPIPKGDIIVAALSSANRDERQFPKPEVFDIAREPNRHVAFGQGIHYCLGAPLARLEGQIAFTTMLRHFPQLRLAVPRASLQWRKSYLLRGLESLPVASA